MMMRQSKIVILKEVKSRIEDRIKRGTCHITGAAFFYKRSFFMTNHVVLYEPLMPANTGNIARTCAGTNTVLDLIEPLGFQIDNKKMKRAGLDYWDKVDIRMHDDLEAFLNTLGPNDEMYLISKFSSKNYAQVDYTDPNKDYYFVFGKETTGLPETFMREYYDRNLRIPMSDKDRKSVV